MDGKINWKDKKITMKKFIFIILFLIISSEAYALPVPVRVGMISNSTVEEDNTSETNLEGKRYKIIAINSYSKKMTVWDKVSGEVFDFRYSPDPRQPCGGNWQYACDTLGMLVMNDVFNPRETK